MWTNSGPDTVRIVRWEAVACGFLLGFRADDDDDFDWAVKTVRALPEPERRWVQRDHAWFVTTWGAAELSHTWPPLRRFLEGGQSDARQPPPPHHHSRSSSPGPAPIPADVAAAFARLHLLPSAPPALVRAARRALALADHPDRAGGDTERMKTVNNAADVCEHWLDREQQAPV